jgi:hypothetical protein
LSISGKPKKVVEFWVWIDQRLLMCEVL